MSKLLAFFGLAPNDEQKEVLKHLRKKEAASMRVVGRGTLTMNAEDARSTEKSKAFIDKIDRLVG
ncbi:hypothetical protein [Shewanella sp.]|uniref:hypothetical protein n=1 Tax=Shewanella sp. TaxID=50422 RepID=UPI003A96BAEF